MINHWASACSLQEKGTKMNSFECRECGLKRSKANVHVHQLYDTPWQERPDIAYTCSDQKGANLIYKGLGLHYVPESCTDLLSDTSYSDFRYFICSWCDREVSEQCQSNGWHSYYRIVNECEQVCLKCYEEDLFENGSGIEAFENGELPGMFFDTADLEKHGFTELVPYTFVNSLKASQALCSKAIEHIRAGSKVLCNYEHMAIGGLEGYASLWSKGV